MASLRNMTHDGLPFEDTSMIWMFQFLIHLCSISSMSLYSGARRKLSLTHSLSLSLYALRMHYGCDFLFSLSLSLSLLLCMSRLNIRYDVMVATTKMSHATIITK